MPCSPSRFVVVACLAAVSMGACSDSPGGDLAEWCALQQRGMRLLLAVDFDAFNEGDPEAIERAADAEEALVALRDFDPPAEIREAFERAIDPAGYQPYAPPEYADARDEVEAYVLENCDLPADLEAQLRDPG